MSELSVARPEAGWAAALAGALLLLVLAVIAASAYVRLASAQVPPASAEAIDVARTIRKSAGAVAALGIAALAIAATTVRATRAVLAGPALGALAMMIVLSIVGLATGTEPPPWAAYTNQFGGVLLAGLLGWLCGRAAARFDAISRDRQLAGVALILCVLQAAFGGALATWVRDPAVALLALHAAVGLAAGCCAGALAINTAPDARLLRALLAVCVAAVPAIGLASTVAGLPASLQVAHALSGAALLACVALALGRLGRAA